MQAVHDVSRSLLVGYSSTVTAVMGHDRELTVVGILESLDTHNRHQDYVCTLLIFFS
jgi:hypothetical protein